MEKRIKLFGGVSILAGIMIGSGIFFLGGQILSRVGNSLLLSLLAWLVGGLITLFSALTYAELGSLFPENGGYFVYLSKAYGKRTAFLSGHMNLVLSSSGSIALLALFFGQFIAFIVPGLGAGGATWLGVWAIVILTIVNWMGLKAGVITQVIFMVAKIIPIVMVILMAYVAGDVIPETTSVLSEMTFFEILIGFGFAVVGTLWAYEGWTNLNAIAGNMKEPKKDLPKALSLSTIGVMIVYVLFIFSMYRLVPYQTIVETNEAGGFFIFNAAYALFGDAGLGVIMISVAISVFGALNGSIMVFPRVYQKMSKNGLFFKVFSKENEFKVPGYSLLISSGVGLTLLLLGFDIDALLTFVVFAGLIFNTLIFFSVFKFRKTHPIKEHPRYQVWGYPTVPIVAIVSMGMLLIATLFESFVPSLIGVVVLAVGYLIVRVTIKEPKKRSIKKDSTESTSQKKS